MSRIKSEELLTPALLCDKEPSFLPYAGSLWHKGAYNRTFPCMEATYPLYHKEPARSKQRLGALDARAGSLWHKRAGVATLWSSRPMRDEPRHSSTDESGEHWHHGMKTLLAHLYKEFTSWNLLWWLGGILCLCSAHQSPQVCWNQTCQTAVKFSSLSLRPVSVLAF